MTKLTIKDMIVLLVALLASGLSYAEQPTRVYRIGLPWTGQPEPSTLQLIEVFRQELRNLGYVDGQNVSIEVQWHSPERPDLLPGIANNLVRSGVDVLVAGSTPQIIALKQATKTIPIVMVAPSDPVGTGLVQSLARPGGNVTGLAWMQHDIIGKSLQLLKEIVPKMSRLADLWNPLNPATRRDFNEIEAAGRTLGITVYSAQVRVSTEFLSAFSSITRAHADAVIIQADPLTITHRRQILDLLAQNRLPSMFFMRQFVDEGGLVSYGASLQDQYRRAAGYVDKILKGARPADLPVEQPRKFDLVINLRTAKALGITIPESILLQADEVIR
jgi:putative ABC transport system substrate-binding protein